MLLSTVKIVRGEDYVIINVADFDPAQHELYEAEVEAVAADTATDVATGKVDVAIVRRRGRSRKIKAE